jgi:hypothetical protein
MTVPTQSWKYFPAQVTPGLMIPVVCPAVRDLAACVLAEFAEKCLTRSM